MARQRVLLVRVLVLQTTPRGQRGTCPCRKCAWTSVIQIVGSEGASDSLAPVALPPPVSPWWWESFEVTSGLFLNGIPFPITQPSTLNHVGCRDVKFHRVHSVPLRLGAGRPRSGGAIYWGGSVWRHASGLRPLLALISPGPLHLCTAAGAWAGRQTGVCFGWSECMHRGANYRGCGLKGFETLAEAERVCARRADITV